MAEHGGLPGGCVVAGLATRGESLHRVVRTRRGVVVLLVALGTVVCETDVIEVGRLPRGGVVAGFATGRDIVSGVIRIRRCIVVVLVAVDAVVGNPSVIKRRWRPSRRTSMARFAIRGITGDGVIGIGRGRILGHVAHRAIACDACVIEYCVTPSDGVVALIAIGRESGHGMVGIGCCAEILEVARRTRV